jgi:hypothetical protein
MKKEIEYISPYVPYGVNSKYDMKDVTSYYTNEVRDKLLTAESLDFVFKFCKLELRRFDDSTIFSYFKPLFGKDDEVTEFFNSDYLFSFVIDLENLTEIDINYLPVGLYNLLLKHKFDIFKQLDNNLAVELKD